MVILGDEFSTVHIDWTRFTAGAVEFHVDVMREIFDERETSAGTSTVRYQGSDRGQLFPA